MTRSAGAPREHAADRTARRRAEHDQPGIDLLGGSRQPGRRGERLAGAHVDGGAELGAERLEDGVCRGFGLAGELAAHGDARDHAARMDRHGEDGSARRAGGGEREVDGAAIGGAGAITGKDGTGHQ